MLLQTNRELTINLPPYNSLRPLNVLNGFLFYNIKGFCELQEKVFWVFIWSNEWLYYQFINR